MYSLSNRSKADHDDADKAFGLFKSCSNAFGIKVDEPVFITVEGGHVEDWKKEISKDVEKNCKPQIVMLFFQKFEEKMYAELKRFMTKELKLPSQVVRKRTLSSPQPARNMSAASKIILQMNAKLGMPLW